MSSNIRLVLLGAMGGVIVTVATGALLLPRQTWSAARDQPKKVAPQDEASASAVLPVRPRSVPVLPRQADNDIRRRIREEVEREPVKSARDLDSYLDELEARARSKGRVTALEVAPGVEMIREHSDDPTALDRFSQRMLRLQAELKGEPLSEPPPTHVVKRELEEKLATIKGAEGEARREAIRAYQQLIEQSGDSDPTAAYDALNAVAARPERVPDLTSLDSLWSAIEKSGDPDERRELISEYLPLLDYLADPEREKRVERLNQLAAARADSSEH